MGCSLGCSSWRDGRLEIVGEETSATKVGVSELGATKEEEARSRIGVGIGPEEYPKLEGGRTNLEEA